MRDATQRGLSIQVKKAEVISAEQEDLLWDSGFLGSDTPQKLRNTIVWIFGLNFDLRAGQEHRNLRMTN